MRYFQEVATSIYMNGRVPVADSHISSSVHVA
jgi:hypothetical protein